MDRPDRKPSPANSARFRSPLPRAICRLIRLRLSLAVAASAAAGVLLHPGPLAWGALALAGAGVFCLAAAASALNQIQELDLDGRMFRTRGRPLPAGQLRPAGALAIALVPAAGGCTLLANAGPWPLLLGLITLLLYHGIYTPLKRHSPLALLPGAGCGALPPIIGWTAAGGAVADYRIVLVAGLIYLWQLPHFWRLTEKYAEDYRRAGLPTLHDWFTPLELRLLRAIWSLALGLVVLQVLLFGLLQGELARLVLPVAVSLLAISTLRPGPQRPGPAWADFCLLLFLLLLLEERLSSPPASVFLAGL
jgi:protoheme IX farnesyltransferase